MKAEATWEKGSCLTPCPGSRQVGRCTSCVPSTHLCRSGPSSCSTCSHELTGGSVPVSVGSRDPVTCQTHETLRVVWNLALNHNRKNMHDSTAALIHFKMYSTLFLTPRYVVQLVSRAYSSCFIKTFCPLNNSHANHQSTL